MAALKLAGLLFHDIMQKIQVIRRLTELQKSAYNVRSSQFAVRSSQFAVRSSQFAVRSSQ